MKNKVLTLCALLGFSCLNAQNLLTENFDTFPTPNWVSNNQSTPIGTTTWQQGTTSASFGGAFNGAPTSYIIANYNSVAGTGTISNWYISPVVSLRNGDVITFYTRKGGTTSTFADRLELRISTNGAATVNPSTGSTSLGDFTTLALSVNPNLNLVDYPFAWTLYSYTVTGIANATDSKIAFRYFVTNTNVNGAVIGIDAVAVNRALSTNEFFKSNFSVYPNPTNSILNVANNSNVAINAIQISDINGRIVKELPTNEISNSLNISELNSGVYFLKIITDQGIGTSKIVKK